MLVCLWAFCLGVGVCVFQVDRSLVVGVIGAGRIGSSIVRAFVSSCSRRVRVVASARRVETLRAVEEVGAEATRDNGYVARVADVLFVCVKPFQFPSVAGEIARFVHGKPVVSVMAGVRLATLEEALPGAVLYRAMPNINALFGESTTALALGRGGEEYRELVVGLLSVLGRVFVVPEEWLDAWTALIGSGPALVAELVDAFVLAGLAVGLPRDVVYKAVLDMVRSTIVHLEKRSVHPLVVRDEVVTPAGTTIEALKVLEKRGVKHGVIDAVEAAARRSRELGSLIDRQVSAVLSRSGDSGGKT